jgi:hypothetical protein
MKIHGKAVGKVTAPNTDIPAANETKASCKHLRTAVDLGLLRRAFQQTQGVQLYLIISILIITKRRADRLALKLRFTVVPSLNLNPKTGNPKVFVVIPELLKRNVRTVS